MYQMTQLKNGARLLTVPYHDTKAVTVLALFPVGSRYETPKLNGVSHFIEHMMFKGTKKRPTTLDISRDLDAVGAEYNAYTSKDHTGYYIKIDAAKIDLALDLLSDMLFRSKFDAREIEREKGVVVEEINMYEDNPTMTAEELFEEALFAGNSLGWKVGGTPPVVKAYPRAGMVKYRDTFYAPCNMVLAVSGKLNGDIGERVAETFGFSCPVKRPSKFQSFRWNPRASKVKIKWKETEQVHVCMGFPSYDYDHARLPAVSLLHVILGGTMSSRLFIEVRERRGLAYMVKTSVNTYQDTGSFYVQAGLKKEKAEEAIKVIVRELARMREHGVTAKELAEAKDNIRGRLILSLEESNALAEWFGKQAALMRRIEMPDERMQKIAAVTREEVQAVARDLFKSARLRMAVIGPYKEAKQFERLLR